MSTAGQAMLLDVEPNLGASEGVPDSLGLSRLSVLSAAHKSENREASPKKDAPKVAILLGTYFGQDYLADQLESIASQTHPNWEVWASDDGSQDNTHTILAAYKRNWEPKRMNISAGPAQGFCQNFLALTCNPSVEADYYAYSDQDDIWERDKLARAVAWLETIPAHIPALYCSRTQLVNADNQSMGLSPLFTKPPCFANALMQNIGGGNTMVFNQATRALLQTAGEQIGVITHDWWVYLVVSGCGGKVFYDPYPSVRYRQHASNQVGMNSSWPAKLKRLHMVFKGRFKDWNNRNIHALQRLRCNLTLENQEILDRFANARERNFISRLIGLKHSGVFRQTLLGNVGLVVAAAFKKI